MFYTVNSYMCVVSVDACEMFWTYLIYHMNLTNTKCHIQYLFNLAL